MLRFILSRRWSILVALARATLATPRSPRCPVTAPVTPGWEAVRRMPSARGRLHWSQSMAVTMGENERDVSKTFAAIAKGDGVEVGCFSWFSWNEDSTEQHGASCLETKEKHKKCS